MTGQLLHNIPQRKDGFRIPRTDPVLRCGVDSAGPADPDTQIDLERTCNPRTAVGIISPLHYIFVMVDGRTEQSYGMPLYKLAEFMQGLGAEIAYNLDGGGSTAMVFNGKLINRPTTYGKEVAERKVSDIVYIR